MTGRAAPVVAPTVAPPSPVQAPGSFPRARQARPAPPAGGRGTVLRRQEVSSPLPDDGAKLKEAAKQTGKAFLETPLGKQMTERAAAEGERFVATTEGRVVTGAVAAGTVAALVATNSELPIGIPDIPLDAIRPGLKLSIVYEGPVRAPTKAMLTFTFTPQPAAPARPAGTSGTPFRTSGETAAASVDESIRRAREQLPEQRAQNEMWEAYRREEIRRMGTRLVAPLPSERRREEESILRREPTPAPHRPAGGEGAPPEVEALVSESGRPLDPGVRAEMERHFGHHFGRVRVHADAAADRAAAAVGARAFAVGSHLAFAAGEYAPHTLAGRRLIAHELAHTVQHDAGAGAGPASGGITIGSTSDPLEHEAETWARSLPATTVSSPPAQRGATPRITGDTRTSVRRRRGGTTPDAAAPERTRIDITGRYEAHNADGNNRITLQINQAGRHFEGWWQEREYRGSRQQLRQRRMVGTLTADAADRVTFDFRIFHESTDAYSGEGTLSANLRNGEVWLTVSRGSWMHAFRRISAAPRLSAEALAGAPEQTRALLQATEGAPLDSEEERRLAANADLLRQLVREFFASSHGVSRMGVALRLDRMVDTIFRQFAPEQVPLVSHRLREILVAQTHRHGDNTRSYLDWLQIVVLSRPDDTRRIQDRLGLTATGAVGENTPQHSYRWRFSTVGLAGDVGVGLGGFLGVFQIEKLAPERWTQQYFTLMGGVSAGLSAGVTVGQTTAWSDFQTPFAWTSANFRGAYNITGGAGGGSAVIGGGFSPGAFIIFYGDGTFPPLTGSAAGFAAVYGLYVGAEVSSSSGFLWGGREEAISDHRSRRTTGTSRFTAAASAHFAVDDPSLTPAGRQAIRSVAAMQRAAFMDSSSALQIDGYTSTTGTDTRNQRLSELRAENALQALRDALGPALAIPADRIGVRGHGAEGARRARVPDQQETEEWRRVDVRLNGRVVLVLQ